MAELIDTHCHLDVEAFDRDRDEVLARAFEAGVAGLLLPSIRPRWWSRVIALARLSTATPPTATPPTATPSTATPTTATPRPTIRIALGIHPQIVPELEPDELADLAAGLAPDELADLAAGLATRIAEAAVSSGAVAIGECGLDGGTANHELQETILRAQIRAARDTRLPLVLHVLRAHDQAPRILRDEHAHEVGGVMHSYSGGAELVSVYRDLGMAFSFAGPITFPNARRPIEAARAIPDELLLAETDSPDQSPDDHRGGRNEPAFLPSVIAALAAARGTTFDAIAALTTANARRRFGAW